VAHPPVGQSWPIEHVPNSDEVYLRVHRSLWTDALRTLALEPSGVSPNWFRARDDSTIVEMSCDWSKYATPEETRNRVTPDQTLNAVIALHAETVRSVSEWDVRHSPDVERGNRAHCDLHGPRSSHTKARVLFARTARVALPLPRTE